MSPQMQMAVCVGELPMYVCMHVCMYVCVCVCVCNYVHMYVYVHAYTHAKYPFQKQTSACLHTHTHTCT